MPCRACIGPSETHSVWRRIIALCLLDAITPRAGNGLSMVRKLLLICVRSEDIVAGKRKRGSMAKGDAPSQPGRPDPEREHENAETLIPGAENDDLAEELGEESVEAATSGQSSAEDNLNAEVPEETGGPFVVENRRRK